MAGPTVSDRVSELILHRNMLLVVSVAGIGSLLFGYDTGAMSVALLYIREDMAAVGRSTLLEETIVSTAIVGAVVGAAFGGWLNDRLGRRVALLVADALFSAGIFVVVTAHSVRVFIPGRLFVGLGFGIASITAPLYIAETSPPKYRGTLVTTSVLLIPLGQLISIAVSLAFHSVRGTWHWMLLMASFPALVQFFLMLFLPESPQWLFRKNRVEQGHRALEMLCASEEHLKAEEEYIRSLVRKEMESGLPVMPWDALRQKEIRLALLVGVGLQAFQQLIGMNTLLYYVPTILQMAGTASKGSAMFLSLAVAAGCMLGTSAGMYFIDRFGRRPLIMWSLGGTILALLVLTVGFHFGYVHAPDVSSNLSLRYGNHTACPVLVSDKPNGWKCDECIRVGCGFCGAMENKDANPGACFVSSNSAGELCSSAGTWFTRGCPSTFGWLTLVGLAIFILCFSAGVGPVPWAVNSEIYPLSYRGMCGGFAAAARWISNLLVLQTFLTLTHAVGTSFTFLLLCGVAVAAFIFVFFLLPETKGLSFEQMAQMWKRRAYAGKMGNCFKCFPRTEVSLASEPRIP